MELSEMDLQQLRALAQSATGQKLLQLLQGKDLSALETAAKHLNTGKMDQAKQTLQSLLQDPQIQMLLSQLGGTK